jgi:hypothetical protein
MSTDKSFLWKDKSGRGAKAILSLEVILDYNPGEMDLNLDWNGNDLHEWARDAEIGDEWENADEKYICLGSEVN